MDFQIINKVIQNKNYYKIGLQGENKVEIINFITRRFYNDIDLFNGIVYLFFSNSSNTGGLILPELGLETEIVVDMVIDEDTGKEIKIEKEVETGNIIIKWLVGSEATKIKGLCNVQLSINGLDTEIWKTEITTFTIANSLNVPTPLPMLFNTGKQARIANVEEEPPITVSNRKIIIPSILQNIAVQNDENSEVVTIKLPRYFDNNDLAKYTLWLTTLSTGGKDNILLTKIIQTNYILSEWTLKPPQTSYVGKLQIQLRVLGNNFEWKSEIASINILPALVGEAIIPTTPDFIDSILKDMSEYANRAETAAVKSEEARDISISKAGEAKVSADNAKVSETNAKSSETATEDALTNMNTGLLSKLPIVEANPLIKSISLDEITGVFTFTRYDGTIFVIDTALEKTIVNFNYDNATKDLILILTNGKELRIPMSDFLNDYTGKSTTTIQTLVSGANEISATIKGNSIGMNLLDIALQNTINSKVTADESNNASQIKFADGKTMQQKLDDGSLKGKDGNDGVSIATNGFYSMYVNQTSGDLIVVVADGADQPPFSLKEDGTLVYTI